MKPVRLAIVTTHPIQYYAPLFRALGADPRVSVRVFYTWSQTEAGPVPDRDFAREIRWDIPLLDGYEYEFVPNVAERPGSDRFRGIINPGLIPAIERWGADAVLIFAWNLASHLGAMRYFKGRIGVYFRGDSTLLDPRPGWRRVLRRLALTWVYRHIDVALAVGSANRDYYRWCGVADSRIVLAPHAVDNERFIDASGDADADAEAQRLRGRFGIPADALVFLFAAKFITKKDPLSLLAAFTELASPAHLVFVGNGPLEHALRSAAAGHPRIHFIEAQNQRAMPAIYRVGDVFVLPSSGPGETWGLAINEAMASGRCVIAGSRAGGAIDLIRPGTDGWIFESGNRASLRDALRRAGDCGRERLTAMGAAAREHVASWSIPDTARRIAQAVTRPAGLPGP